VSRKGGSVTHPGKGRYRPGTQIPVELVYKVHANRADMTPRLLATRVGELMARRKPNHSVLFVVDEVGQFVARDVDKMGVFREQRPPEITGEERRQRRLAACRRSRDDDVDGADHDTHARTAGRSCSSPEREHSVNGTE